MVYAMLFSIFDRCGNCAGSSQLPCAFWASSIVLRVARVFWSGPGIPQLVLHGSPLSGAALAACSSARMYASGNLVGHCCLSILPERVVLSVFVPSAVVQGHHSAQGLWRSRRRRALLSSQGHPLVSVIPPPVLPPGLLPVLPLVLAVLLPDVHILLSVLLVLPPSECVWFLLSGYVA